MASQGNGNDNGHANDNGNGHDKRGFASMEVTKQREIAREGGKAAHQKGVAHEFTPDEAREAGRRGGQAVSQNREHMARIGRKGGEARGRKALARRANQPPTIPLAHEAPEAPGEGR